MLFRLLSPLLLVSVVLGLAPPPSWDRNDSLPKVLFITNAERGQANIQLATAHALLVDHHDSIDVHLASFPVLQDTVERVSQKAIKAIIPAGRADAKITFHSIDGVTHKIAMLSDGLVIGDLRHAPGLRGFHWFVYIFEKLSVPWTGPEYMQIYQSVSQIVTDVDPTFVVVDGFFSAAIDAVLKLRRARAVLSPNSPKDTVAGKQDKAKQLWHYPVISSGFPYPVPWYLIPANIYMNLRMAWAIQMDKGSKELKTYAKAHGANGPPDFFEFFFDDPTPWLIPSAAEVEYPITFPEKVVLCGPIYMALDAVEDEDAGLAAWLAQAPTVLIVLGSHTTYSEEDATQMRRAIGMILDGDDRVQVLWKLTMVDGINTTATMLSDEIAALVSTGRVRVQPWLPVDPASMLESGHVICYVHHGGANSFTESIGTGVPQVILPMWADTYDYAVRAEWLGVGIWANRQAPPGWTGEEISQAVLRVTSNDPSSADGRSRFHRRARALATKSREQAGRVVAAREIARMVRTEQERRKRPVQGEEDILDSNNQIPIQSESRPAGYDEL